METVTPLFLGGSNPRDPRDEPELRAASFRGALRFWFRALLGGVLGDKPDDIFRYESQVFGSTEHASPVIVRILQHDLKSSKFKPLPHKEVLFNGFKPGQKFELTLISRDQNALQQAKKALQLLSYLGGLGRRSRRGFGSLQIVDGEMALNASSADELAKALTQQLDLIFPRSFAELRNLPRFPLLHPKWTQVKVCRTEFNDWKDAIRFVMQKAHEHKNPALGFANPRQASPVHVHVTKLQTGKYAIVLTTMLSQLNPQLRAEADRKKLVDFLNEFDGKIAFPPEEVPKKWLGGKES